MHDLIVVCDVPNLSCSLYAERRRAQGKSEREGEVHRGVMVAIQTGSRPVTQSRQAAEETAAQICIHSFFQPDSLQPARRVTEVMFLSY